MDWEASPNLPARPRAFNGISFDEMVGRARELAPVLRERAEACESLRRLPAETERELHETGLFRIVQPARVGGAELDIGIIVEVCAELAAACPSTAWNLANLGSHHWMLAYFPPEAQETLWSRSPDVLIATSLVFPAGRSRKVEGGYVVSGRWPLSSGVDNSDWNMLATTVREADDGPPVGQRFVLLHRSQYRVIDNWHAMGLAGTGSSDVVTEDTFVPEAFTLDAHDLSGRPHPGSNLNAGPLFRLPMLALGPFVLSGVMLGCARGAYAATVEPARTRNATTTGQPFGAAQAIQIKVAEAAALIDAAALIMRTTCEAASQAARDGVAPDLETKLRYRRDGALASQFSLRVAGSGGLRNSHAVQRLFRDAHAAAAHVMLSFEAQGTLYGQHALAVDAPAPLI